MDKRSKKKYMKLHLGSASKHIEGYLNIDIREMDGVDIVDDVKTLNKISNNSVDVIYVSHVLEHFGRWEYKDVLRRWFEILKPNGILRIAVPDFESVVKLYLKTKDLNLVMGMLYGGQNYGENYHYCTFDFNLIKKELTDVGFSSINLYDWRNTDHSDIDDYSQSYYPHMDKENGLLMSLNVEAIK